MNLRYGKYNLPKRLINIIKLSASVDERVRFVVSQALRRSGTSGYTLRDSSIRVYLRDGTPDLAAFTQIFQQDHYSFPPAASEYLATQDKPLKFVDLGGNIGVFAAKLFKLFPLATITAFEPDPKSLEILNRFASGNPEKSFKIVAACASSSSGSTPFLVGRNGISRIPSENEVDQANREIVKQVDVFPYIQDADFVKFDIEGGEWSILEDPRFESLKVPIVVLEYHQNLCPAQDPEQFARERLESAGYIVSNEDFIAPDDHGVLWGIRNLSISE